MNKLIVIGNGFDIAHGLHTDYNYFLEQLTAEHTTFYEMVCQYIPEDALWATFEEALSYLDDEQLQDDNSCYLLGYGDDNWRDSAHHDFQYMIGQALDFAPDIPNYFREWIQGINTCVQPIMPSHIVAQDNLFLSFNYTDTLERVYGIPANHILYIHGKALRGDNLILGHHNETLVQDEPEPVFETEEEREFYYDNYSEDVRVLEAREIIKSYFKETFMDTTSIIEANHQFFNSLFRIQEIYIFGHSLSAIDFDYFLEIKRCTSPTCRWYISYHSEDDFYNAQNFVQSLRLQNYQLFPF